MINGALYRQGCRGSWKVLTIFFAVLALYTAVIVSMFDPRIGELLDSFMEMMPGMMAMFGMDSPGTTLAQFMANYLYGMLMLVFPMVFAAVTANRLVARHVDRGSMAYLLAAPNSRAKVIVTQMAVLLSGVTVLIALCTLVGLVSSAAMFPGELDVAGYLRLNLGALLLQIAISGLCFFASCVSNDTGRSLGLGAGVVTGFYLLHMLANMGGKLEKLRVVNLFTLFDTEKLLAGETAGYVMIAVLGAIGAALYAAGGVIFCKRDIPV